MASPPGNVIYLRTPRIRFGGLGDKYFRIEDAKPVYVFDETTELAFFKAADA